MKEQLRSNSTLSKAGISNSRIDNIYKIMGKEYCYTERSNNVLSVEEFISFDFSGEKKYRGIGPVEIAKIKNEQERLKRLVVVEKTVQQPKTFKKIGVTIKRGSHRPTIQNVYERVKE